MTIPRAISTMESPDAPYFSKVYKPGRLARTPLWPNSGAQPETRNCGLGNRVSAYYWLNPKGTIAEASLYQDDEDAYDRFWS